ncbi:hypothetical protein O6H91_18G065600 [Diphasiastrum complanatum]|uniref:Uncharacterized protein n=1 Tax=Diphasiastrum complanatum TaxID=34168 RepID=A0ACC2B276_DIPCM|nr:hypothetical protein O6H91_18G065600 [Diphasiastrum complanatum]
MGAMADDEASTNIEMELEFPCLDCPPSVDGSPVGLPGTTNSSAASSAVLGAAASRAAWVAFSPPSCENQLASLHFLAGSLDTSALSPSSSAPRSLPSEQALHRAGAAVEYAPPPSLSPANAPPSDISCQVKRPHAFFPLSFAAFPSLAASAVLVGSHASHLSQQSAKEDFQPDFSSLSPSFFCTILNQHGGFELNPPTGFPRAISSYQNLQAAQGPQEEAPDWALPSLPDLHISTGQLLTSLLIWGALIFESASIDDDQDALLCAGPWSKCSYPDTSVSRMRTKSFSSKLHYTSPRFRTCFPSCRRQHKWRICSPI